MVNSSVTSWEAAERAYSLLLPLMFKMTLFTSSFSMVPVAVAVVIVAALLGLDRVTVKVSSASMLVSPLTLTVMILEVSLAAKVTVPVGNVPPKSAALAGLAPVPVTAHLTVFIPVVLPERVTLKVKALLPELPSVCTALLGAIAKVEGTLL